jgi:hypothetical protein
MTWLLGCNIQYSKYLMKNVTNNQGKPPYRKIDKPIKFM